jgi:hypothetical protein
MLKQDGKTFSLTVDATGGKGMIVFKISGICSDQSMRIRDEPLGFLMMAAILKHINIRNVLPKT